MKRALADRLPADILHRTKMGFVTPVSAWFRGPLAHEALAIGNAPSFAELGWFDASAIRQFAEAHLSGRADHGRLLWQLMMLDKSLQNLFGLGGGAVSRPDTAPRQNRARRAAR
jgi:asparagine synthase (glutamine-hydrolysing)